MKKISLLVLCLFAFAFVKAQIANVNTNMSGVPLRLKSYKDIQGSPYLFDDWQEANFLSKEGVVVESVYIRYNIYEDKVEYKKEGETYQLMNESVKGFIVGVPDNDGRMKRTVFQNGFNDVKGFEKGNFFAVLFDGKVKFLQKIEAKLVETTATYGTSSTLTKFVKEESFYFVNEKGETNKIKRNNSSLLKILNDKSLNNFVKENDLNIKEDSALLKTLQFYESLLN